MLTLGQKIKAIRKEKGLTQAELVEDRITRNQLSLIENGINNPSISTLEFIAQRLNVPMSYFLSNDDFSMHKSQRLIAKAESLLDLGEYSKVIIEIEAFLNDMDGIDENSMTDVLGRIYAILGNAYFNTDKSKAKQILLQAVKNLDSTDYSYYLSKTYSYLGLLFLSEHNLTDAESYLFKANDLLENVSLENVILKLDIAYSLSYTYLRLHKYNEIIEFVNDSLKYSKKYKIFHNYGELNLLVSAAYRFTYNYKQAIFCTHKAIEYFQFSDDELNKNICYSNLGIYYRLANDYENSLKSLDMAKKYFEFTEKITKLLNTKAEIVKTMFLSESKPEYFDKLLNEAIADVSDNNENKPDLLAIKGVYLLENNNVDEAYGLFIQAEALAARPEQYEFIIYAFLGLSKISKHRSEWENAYKYLDKANALPYKAIKNIQFE